MPSRKPQVRSKESKKAARPRKPEEDSAILFENKHGHTMRLSRSMTLRELVKMGVVEIHLSKPGEPLRDGEWRDASNRTQVESPATRC